jgi:hypothetical protein
MSKLQSWRWFLMVAVLGQPGCSKATVSEPGSTSLAPTQNILPSASPIVTESSEPLPSPSPPHTERDRLALFDELVAATLRRHAFSDEKTTALRLDFEHDAAPLRDEFRTAQSDLELFRAIARLSGLRCDAHMDVTPIAGGLAVDATEYSSGIEFAPDFELLDERVFCVQRVAANLQGTDGVPQVGDVLVSINGQTVADFDRVAGPYLMYSTLNGRAWALAHALGTQPAWWPTMEQDHQFRYRLRNVERGEYECRLAGVKAQDVSWLPLPSRTFPGFTLSLSLPSFDLYRPAAGQNIVAFEWKGFTKDDLINDLAQLISYASGNELLDHDIIVDFTRSRGGSDGVLALQVLLGQPFKTTFGDLRISDVIDPFIASREASPRLRDWLHNDVRAAQARGDAYTAPVPFKLRHLPADSDGVLQPASQHFTGRLVALFGSQVGSQVDQVAAIVIDSAASHSIGMPTGGYSNSWEWEEHVKFPTTGQPVAEFIWSMGRTYRPNGEELEGNPPTPDEVVLLTHENVTDYYDRLLQHAVEYLNSK